MSKWLLLLVTFDYVLASLKLNDIRSSWDTVPVFAFPGDHNGFLNENDIKNYHLDEFPQLVLWGYNVSCIDPINGTIYPAAVSPPAWYSCGANHSYYANMETSLQFQAKQIKQMTNNSNLITFGYIEFTNVQQSYIYQQIFNSPQHQSWWLQLQNIGIVNCYVDGCNWEGPEWHQYDYRQPAVADYFINTVVTSVANSSYIDGIFLDTISCWTENLCDAWRCTDTEYNELFNASLLVTQQTVDMLTKMNKYISVSSHVDLYFKPEYYRKYREILKSYPKTAIRYWEALETGMGSSFYNHFVTLINETRDGIMQHVHAGKKTMNPSFVELAAFLIAANDKSWFSYSNGWMVDSHWWQDEYNKSLGNPLTEIGNCTMDNKWYIYNNTNNVYNKVEPKQNSTDGNVIYIGQYDNYESCLNAIQKINVNGDKFGSFTWVKESNVGYKYMCYGRYTDAWDDTHDDTTISGHLGNMYCTRKFEHCYVELNVLEYSANITWLQ
eukprot:281213_1